MSTTLRNARLLRVDSTRDVCIFCANRQLAVRGIIRSVPTLSQRRHLNSSRKAPQYAAEDQLYRERPSGEFGSTRSQLLQPRDSGGAAWARQPLSIKKTIPGQASGNEAYGNDYQSVQRQQRRLQLSQDSAPRSYGSTQYKVAPLRPPIVQLPEFGSIQHLRRRNDQSQEQSSQSQGQQNTSNRPSADELAQLLNMNSSQTPAQQPQRPPRREPIRKLDSDELDRLLRSNSRRDDISNPRRAEPWATTRANSRRPPGDDELNNLLSTSSDGFRGSASRYTSRRSQPERKDTPMDAEQWIRHRASQVEVESAPQIVQEEKRKREDENDRRRRRFIMEEELAAAEREEPETDRRNRKKDERRKTNGRIRRNEEEDEDDSYASRAQRKAQRKEERRRAKLENKAPTPILLPEYISVANLASMLKLRAEDFVRKLESLGFEDVQMDNILSAEHAGLVAMEYNFEPIVQTEGEDGDLHPAPAPSPEEYAELPARPPVVTIMGHVDHGKTTILDYIRSTSVAAGEFGGITQHIGAFSVPLSSGKKITFLDTPGHAAFETMRKRGANVTDIVVLVVAADDSVKPQTVEAIKHAQSAGVPIIVAINKIDKDQADPDRVRQDLTRHGITVEEYGGDVQSVCLSGKTGRGISDLEDAIVLLSEVLDHRANPKANVEGWVLEGSTKKDGKVATVLVRQGTLRVGDALVAGTTWARVRVLKNEAGVEIKEAGPGMPVEVYGWRDQPIAGDEVLQAGDEQAAADVSELRKDKEERLKMAKDMEAINDSRKQETERKRAEAAAAAREGDEKDGAAKTAEGSQSGPLITPFIVKGDVSGSVEAVIDSLVSIGNHEVGCQVLRSGVGPPSEFDVQHAAAAKGHIINFNTSVPSHVASLAEEKGVQILDSNIIYRVVETVKDMLSEQLPPRITAKVIGEAEVAAVFDIGLGGKKKMKIAGAKVKNGVIDKKMKIKVTRGDTVVYDGTMSSLKNQKKDVDQMRKDTECGVAFDDWEDFHVGDKLQCYEEIREKRTL